jgi:hypothetical protein
MVYYLSARIVVLETPRENGPIAINLLKHIRFHKLVFPWNLN